jgi:ethanolamine ammonia-lyase small subunit
MTELTPGSWTTRLRALTPARVGLARTGVSQGVRDHLDFQRAHAQARDAVHARLEMSALTKALREASDRDVMHLHSQAADRAIYLQRPDLGRQLDEESKAALGNGPQGPFDLSIVIADGLSALAVERHAAPLLHELLPRLNGWKLAPICIVEQGRVAIGDEIGDMQKARLCVVLLGERPGLSAPDSLGVYITWTPRVGRTDAERNCISNIRGEGLSCGQAAEQLFRYLTEARLHQGTGVGLRVDSRMIGEG